MSVLVPESPVVLPEYTPSQPAPSYSTCPLSDEQTLDHSPRSGASRVIPDGTFIRKAGSLTIILKDQEDGTQQPSFGRHAVVSGAICLENSAIVSDVVIKLQGKIDLTISEGGSKSHKILDDSYTLWSMNRDCNMSSCPSTIPFSFIFPSTYVDHDSNRTRPLPPSYDVGFPGVPGLFAKCFYSLIVTINKVRHRKLTFLTKTKIVTIRVNYYPRTRPHRPNIVNACLFSTLKVAPEEWQQASAKMLTRPTARIQPLDCHLMIPAAQIFGLCDTIPFHIQLTGPISSLRAFLPPLTTEPEIACPPTTPTTPTSPLSPLSRSQTTTTTTTIAVSLASWRTKRFSRQRVPTASKPPVIRVFLLRQISVEVRGQRAWRNCNFGEGKLWPVPPRASVDCLTAWEGGGEQEGSLDWEGEVRCRENVTVGGFNAGKLSVKDFIVLALTPPDPHLSPLLELQHAHPIRLVTDSWADVAGPEHEHRS